MPKSNQKRYRELKTLWFIGFLLLLCFLVIVILKRFTGEEFYVESYRPSVDQANEYRRLEAEQTEERAERKANGDDRRQMKRLDQSRPSDPEPRPYGFRESDIDKSKGNRYQAF